MLNKQQALHKIAAFCSLTERCCYEVREKLERWNVNPEWTEEIISYLVKEKFIDEVRFTKSFVNDKIFINKWGKIKVSFSLKQKRIDPGIIASALENIDEEAYYEMLSKLLQSKKKTIRAKDDYDMQNKLMRFGLSRGFTMEEIKHVIKYESDF